MTCCWLAANDHGVEKFVQRLGGFGAGAALWFGFGFMGVAELEWVPTATKCKRAKGVAFISGAVV